MPCIPWGYSDLPDLVTSLRRGEAISPLGTPFSGVDRSRPKPVVNPSGRAYSSAMDDDKPGFSLPYKVPFSVVAAVFALTFIVWIFFDQMEMPLHAQGTTVVAAVTFGLVSAVKWLWPRIHRGG